MATGALPAYVPLPVLAPVHVPSNVLQRALEAEEEVPMKYDTPHPHGPPAYERMRKVPIITTYMCKVRHLPRHPNVRRDAMHTLCGKWGFYWMPHLQWRGQTRPPKLKRCAECKRRLDRQTSGYKELVRKW